MWMSLPYKSGMWLMTHQLVPQLQKLELGWLSLMHRFIGVTGVDVVDVM